MSGCIDNNPIERILLEHPGMRLVSSTTTHLFAKDALNTKWKFDLKTMKGQPQYQCVDCEKWTEYLTENNHCQECVKWP